MNVLPLCGNVRNCCRRELPVRAFCNEKLGTVGEEFRCAALVRFHVCVLGANYAVVGLAKRCQRQRVSCGAVEGKEDFAICFKEIAECVGCARSPGIVSIGGRMAPIGTVHGVPRLGTDTGIVVAGKLLREVKITGFCHVLVFWLLQEPASVFLRDGVTCWNAAINHG